MIKRWDVKAEVNMSANNIKTITVSANTERKAYTIAKKYLEKCGYFKVIILSIKQI